MGVVVVGPRDDEVGAAGGLVANRRVRQPHRNHRCRGKVPHPGKGVLHVRLPHGSRHDPVCHPGLEVGQTNTTALDSTGLYILGFFIFQSEIFCLCFSSVFSSRS